MQFRLMEKPMYNFPKVGPEQERFSLFTGEWDSQVRFYFDPPNHRWRRSGAISPSSILAAIFDREFEVQLDDAGDFAELAFHGRGLTGYDPFAGRYLGIWADSGSPALYRTEGTFDASGKVFTESSVGPGPDGKELHLRLITEVIDPDRQRFSIQRLMATGEDVLIPEMVHARRQ
ncbi:DUF1579 family protein [Bradyrhizobium sp. RDT10]